jgi:dGTPase
MINRVVADVITTTAANLAAAAPRDIDAVRGLSRPLVAMSETVHAEHQELKRFLNEALYRHYRVLRMTNKARRVLKELFAVLLEDPDLLPGEHRAAAAQAEQSGGKTARARVVADYVAGMTDRYAIVEHRRLFNPDARS